MGNFILMKIDGSYNRVLGVDGQFRFKDEFFFSFQAIGSKTKYVGILINNTLPFWVSIFT